MSPAAGSTNTFCVQCGARLDHGAAPTQQDATPTQQPAPRRSRRILGLILVFLLGILLGWLLSPKCAQCPHPNDGDGRVMGSGSPSKGSGASSKLGTGSGTADSEGGSSHAHGDVQSGGSGSDAGPGTGADAGGGGGGGGKTAGGSGEGVAKEAEAASLNTAVARYATGQGQWGRAVQDTAASTATAKVLTAPDFTYDKTGLPRYTGSVQHVASALSYKDADQSQEAGSSVGITTGDSFETVVGWYQQRLEPAGWHNQTMGDMGQLAKQLSIENLRGMLSGGSASAGTEPSPTQDRLSVSIFSPPAGTTNDPGVMIVQRGGQPVTIMMKTHKSH